MDSTLSWATATSESLAFSSANSEYKNYSINSCNFACCFTWLWNSVSCIQTWMAELWDEVLSRLFGRKGEETRTAEENCTLKRRTIFILRQIIWWPSNQGWWDGWVVWYEWKSVHAEFWWGKTLKEGPLGIPWLVYEDTIESDLKRRGWRVAWFNFRRMGKCVGLFWTL